MSKIEELFKFIKLNSSDESLIQLVLDAEKELEEKLNEAYKTGYYSGAGI